ncbi:hypothetical protein M407DRAFT_246967 [Tulasnella calospora MUT 4182]|uniref:Protein kinase domain-containing protein n=1 Tax=Tulasnella calospora MUT 4182 TaxID=1051891 RepID=A0A0C3Q2A8_9AGAM|nr:hypothetical protein M407DRAFT_246967 [Tulasnella calospora MUT 4182]
MKDDALGFNPFFAGPVKPVAKLCDMLVSIPDNPGQSLKLGKVLDRRTGIVGRATLVHRAQLRRGEESTQNPGEFDVVLKSSWQHQNRKPESDILQNLHSNERARTYIVGWYAGWEQENTSRNWQRAKFGLQGIVVDDRALRHTVVEYLNPITKLSQPFHVRHIGWSILNAIGFLNDNGWFHRDISIGNMGFVTLPECGGVLVKLHDFDLSKAHNSPQDNPHWTGTLPFVAIGLLECQNAKPRIGFDVEALIWTLLWIVQVHGDGEAVDAPFADHPLKDWFDDPTNLHKLATNKRNYLLNPPQGYFTNAFYRPLNRDMKELALAWYNKQAKLLMERLDQNQEAEDRVLNRLAASPEHLATGPAYARFVEGLVKQELEDSWEGETVYLSDEVYGQPSFTFVREWMEKKEWHKLQNRCSCPKTVVQAHCAQFKPKS